MASIISAKDNKVGVVCVAHDAELYAVKVLDAYGSGYLSDLAEGIDWSISNGIQVINLSGEVQSDLPLFRDSIKRTLDAGVIVVAAAGRKHHIPSFSSRGKINLSAPGVDIRSTYLDNGYANLSGTSMAAPHVTGVLALMLADIRNDADGNGFVSTKEVRNVIVNCAEDIGPVGNDEIFGSGILKCK